MLSDGQALLLPSFRCMEYQRIGLRDLQKFFDTEIYSSGLAYIDPCGG